MNKSIFFKIFLISLIALVAFVNFKFFHSSILQGVILKDYNSSQYTLMIQDFDRFDRNFPNITQTTIPITLLEARYYKHYDSLDSALNLTKKSIGINPYLMASEAELSLRYYDLEEYDSAYYYGKKAFDILPNNNVHRHAYFQSIEKKGDTTELDNAFNKIKYKNNSSHWLEYMLVRSQMDSNSESYSDSILSEYTSRFKEKKIKINILNSVLKSGAENMTSAVYLSIEGKRLFDEKKYLESAGNYELAIDLDPFDYTFYQNAALAYSNTDKTQEAITYFDKVIYDFKIRDGKSHFYKGILLVKQNKIEEGCRYLKVAANFQFSGESSEIVYQRFCSKK